MTWITLVPLGECSTDLSTKWKKEIQSLDWGDDLACVKCEPCKEKKAKDDKAKYALLSLASRSGDPQIDLPNDDPPGPKLLFGYNPGREYEKNKSMPTTGEVTAMPTKPRPAAKETHYEVAAGSDHDSSSDYHACSEGESTIGCGEEEEFVIV
ncbi:hypothetical protein BDW59DRAFT_160488 [Aspergillus cavernicola]|uniref:Stc1 domain-containing protein n=1 Tax=Aspergillus cavernicola TaxID=176166 RepID=A0ABR4IHF3_9EURO